MGNRQVQPDPLPQGRSRNESSPFRLASFSEPLLGVTALESGFARKDGKPANAGGIVCAFMPPAFAGLNALHIYPQLALWAHRYVASYAGYERADLPAVDSLNPVVAAAYLAM
jgi:hypothetical protein